MDNKLQKIKFFLTEYNTAIFVEKKYWDESFLKEDTIILNANCSDEELLGDPSHYASWYSELKSRKNNSFTLLVIDVDNSTLEQQQRFSSLIRDRIITYNKLPSNCRVVVIASSENKVSNILIEDLMVI